MKIAIWGAGKFGRYIKKQLDEREDITLIGFIDSNKEKQGSVDGLEIITLSQARRQADIILIAILEYSSALAELKEDKEGIGVINGKVYLLRKKIFSNILQDKNILWLQDVEKINKPLLVHLETNIIDGCNLNCRGCSHFSNLFEKDEHVSYESFCKDLQQIAEHTYIASLYLLGGEALLNEKLTDYLEFSRKLLPFADIYIVSNGLLIPSQPNEFFKVCRENDIVISISGYKPTMQIKDKIIYTLENNQVDYFFRGEVETFGKNIDLQGQVNIEEAVLHCRESACHFFRHGKLYKCPFAALGNYFFEHYEIPICLHESIDIYDFTLDWKEEIRKLCNEPIEACRYCGAEERFPWERSDTPDKEEWLINS